MPTYTYTTEYEVLRKNPAGVWNKSGKVESHDVSSAMDRVSELKLGLKDGERILLRSGDSGAIHEIVVTVPTRITWKRV